LIITALLVKLNLALSQLLVIFKSREEIILSDERIYSSSLWAKGLSVFIVRNSFRLIDLLNSIVACVVFVIALALEA
jgi:hypothetical protein